MGEIIAPSMIWAPTQTLLLKLLEDGPFSRSELQAMTNVSTSVIQKSIRQLRKKRLIHVFDWAYPAVPIYKLGDAPDAVRKRPKTYRERRETYRKRHPKIVASQWFPAP